MINQLVYQHSDSTGNHIFKGALSNSEGWFSGFFFLSFSCVLQRSIIKALVGCVRRQFIVAPFSSLSAGSSEAVCLSVTFKVPSFVLHTPLRATQEWKQQSRTSYLIDSYTLC